MKKWPCAIFVLICDFLNVTKAAFTSAPAAALSGKNPQAQGTPSGESTESGPTSPPMGTAALWTAYEGRPSCALYSAAWARHYEALK